ncbi:MAG TPA: right-handed parallel beta-helix repeat-containing protein [Pseudonocardiaceae bacterium]|nr:right-handed parallel beta-helix repeat-containing protein [Pseudonocardiaceae bacterium]
MAITTQADLAAALAIGGDVVCDPTVTIELTDTMTVAQSGTRVLGGTFTRTTGPAFLVTASNVELSGLNIVGGNTGIYDDSQKLVYVLGVDGAPLSDIDIHDCHVTNTAAHGIWLEWCSNSRVHSNVVEHCLYSGVMIISGDGIVIADNVISDVVIAPGQANCYGIALTDSENSLAARTQRCIVSGNRVSLVDWEGIDTHGGDGLVITGNAVSATRRCIAVITGNDTRVAAPTHCVVNGNVVDGTGARVVPDIGIFLSGFSGAPASAVITGNQIVGYDSAQPISTNFWQRVDTMVANNSRPHVPWTGVTLTNGWTASSSFPPQFTVDGNTVSFRGGVVPPAGGISAHPVIGSLVNPASWPAARTFYATTHGSNGASGIGVLNVDTDGTLRIDYGSTTDAFTYWLTGMYSAI